MDRLNLEGLEHVEHRNSILCGFSISGPAAYILLQISYNQLLQNNVPAIKYLKVEVERSMVSQAEADQ